MPKSVLEGFGNNNAQFEPPNSIPNISEDIQQTISRLFGFNPDQKRFLLINADTDGHLLVSQQTTKTSTGVITRITLTGSDQLALVANSSRRSFRLMNKGATTVKVAFVTPIATSYFTLDANGTYSDDIYSGNIYLNGTATNTVEVLEY